MPKYLFRGSYTAAGAAGVLKEGGSARAAAAEALIKSVGGTVESNYWAFGEDDFFIVADLPDAAAAAAASLTVGASGAVRVTTTQLMAAGELDEATRRRADYRPPGA
jgi:uncharacterized protein with GYD domain